MEAGQDTPPPPGEWPMGAVAWCVVCHRFIRVGRPYRMVGPGEFAHRGPCLVIQGGKQE